MLSCALLTVVPDYHIRTEIDTDGTAWYDSIIKISDRVGRYKMLQKLREQLNEIIVGKEQVIDDLLVCLLAGGHVLLEDVPGVGKTTLARALAASVGCSFGRIQFTPDTLPSDVTGLSIYNMKTGEFSYREGAVMHQIILADEINRTSPKTQASLLEAMAEAQVTVDGTCYPLPDPFMVIATQNPIEYIGTYPLPEAQLDRFMMRLTVGYPSREDELRMTRNHLAGKDVEHIQAVCRAEDILHLRKETASLPVSDRVLGFAQEIVSLTRKDSRLSLGASPRALLSLVHAAQAHAFLKGERIVRPDDVKAVAVSVLHHRIVLTTEACMAKEDPDKLLVTLIAQAKIPKE